MSVKFMAVGATTPAITGILRTEFPMLEDSMDWALLLIGTVVGSIFGALGIRFAGPTNVVSTAVIGICKFIAK